MTAAEAEVLAHAWDQGTLEREDPSARTIDQHRQHGQEAGGGETRAQALLATLQDATFVSLLAAVQLAWMAAVVFALFRLFH
jgi:hypothetical protein